MSFGRNPHVEKAEAAEVKALSARDKMAREQAWREAAHRWERAAEREKDQKRRELYTQRAESARQSAEEPQADAEASDVAARPAATPTSDAAGAVAAKSNTTVLN